MTKAKKPTPLTALARNGDVTNQISPEHLELHRLNIGRMNRITELEQEAAMLKAVVGAWMQDMQRIYGLSDTDGIDTTGAILRAPQQTVDT